MSAELHRTAQHNAELPDQRMPSRPGILVIGDWLVDEHWVVGEHRWPSSSRIGLRHTRALSTSDASVRSLCGAGQVATILHQAKDETDERFADIFGLGLWRPEDTTALANMLDPIHNKYKTPHSVSHKEQKNILADQLYNLAGKDYSKNIGTTRIIRIYVQTGDTVELVQRVDWELPNQVENGFDDRLARLSELASKGNFLISNIVVKDLRKGVVSTGLVDWLAAKFPDANWFVSSKAWFPKWLEHSNLNRQKVKLIIIPQLAIIDGVREERIPSSPWITTGGEPSEEALETMDELAKQFGKAAIVALPGGMSILARESGPISNKLCGVVQPDEVLFKRQDFVPMASVFLPALLAHMIHDSFSSQSLVNQAHSLETKLKLALSFTKQWMEEESRRLTVHDWLPGAMQELKLGNENVDSFHSFRSFQWLTTKALWKNAFSDLGVLELASSSSPRKANPEFHLWRAMTDIGGYVACSPDKRAVLQRLLQEGRAFLQDKSRSRSFLVIDTPGSGKSFLVNCLARSLGMRFLSFNITQMHMRNDLIECFDTIVTTQAQEPKQGVLVFIDEINGRLGGQHVYDAFLAPLEDGIYVRAGKTFHIGPCLWIFAGTEKPVPRSRNIPKGQLGKGSDDRADKGSDFESRLTLQPFDLKTNVKSDNQSLAKMEKIYVGVAAIRSAFPDVRLVSRKVLTAFSILPPDVGPREITRWVKTFVFVQYGRIAARNLPTNWDALFHPKKRKHNPDPAEIELWQSAIKNWKDIKNPEPENSFVEIQGERG